MLRVCMCVLFCSCLYVWFYFSYDDKVSCSITSPLLSPNVGTLFKSMIWRKNCVETMSNVTTTLELCSATYKVFPWMVSPAGWSSPCPDASACGGSTNVFTMVRVTGSMPYTAPWLLDPFFDPTNTIRCFGQKVSPRGLVTRTRPTNRPTVSTTTTALMSASVWVSERVNEWVSQWGWACEWGCGWACE